MSQENIELTKKLMLAFETKDVDTCGAFLHPEYKFRGPMVQLNSPQESIEFMKNCPFKAKHENAQFLADGNRVAVIFDWVVSEPFQGTFRMCDVITFKDGKISFEELFYDSAKFPKEFMEKMMKDKAVS